MKIYNVNFKRLALLLLPTALRRPIIFAILKSSCRSFDALQAKLFNFQNDCDVRMTHTPQVCYLKGILNDTFCEGTARRFSIEDTEPLSGEWIMTYKEIDMYSDIIPMVEEYTMLYMEDAIKEIGQDFIVRYPSGVDISSNDGGNEKYRKMQALVNMYRLAGKTALYVEAVNS